MPLPPITTYCTAADVRNRLSADGVALRTDDASPAALTDALESAAVEVNGYAEPFYEPAALALSNWVRFKARDIAVYLLCLRRNNPVPKSVQARYDKAIKDLEGVRAGWVVVPDAAQRRANTPVLSNMRVASYPVPHPVVVAGTSTGEREGYVQNIDRMDILDYSI
jgi:phage gp36-like protein